MVVLAVAALLVVLGIALLVLDDPNSARPESPDGPRAPTNRGTEWPAGSRGPSGSDPPEAA